MSWRRFSGGLLLAAGVALLAAAVVLVFTFVREPWHLAPVALAAAASGALLATGGMRRFGAAAVPGIAWTATLITAITTTAVVLWVAGLALHATRGWPGWPFHLGLALTVVGLVAWAVRHQLAWGRRVQDAMAAYRTTPVGLLRPGDVAKVRGTVANPGLLSPVSEVSCAAWDADVLGFVPAQHDWALLGSVPSGASFELRTDDGTVGVGAGKAEFQGGRQQLLPIAVLPDELAEALADHPLRAAAKEFSARERVVLPGMRVVVLGRVDAAGVLREGPHGALLIQVED